MTTRIVMIAYVNPLYSEDGDQCTGCSHLAKTGTVGGACEFFGPLPVKPGTTQTYQRHPNCIRAEDRTRHASHSELMMKDDFR